MEHSVENAKSAIGMGPSSFDSALSMLKSRHIAKAVGPVY